MSDYLNSLVSRTLGLTPVVQPRLASFFEPVSAGPANEPAMEVSEARTPRETFAPPVQVTTELPDTPVQSREANVESRRPIESTAPNSVPGPLVTAPTMP